MYALLAKRPLRKTCAPFVLRTLQTYMRKSSLLPHNPVSIKPKNSKASKDIGCAQENIGFSMPSTTMPKP
jgi:hypothetical protein